MTPKRLVTVSKFLSKHLRHEPEALGLRLAEGGWVPVADLLAAADRTGFRISPEELARVVRENDKQRFSFDPTGTQIRANQGHSVEVDLQLEPTEPPPTLFHGTAEKTLPVILRDGLKKIDRHHVHLSLDAETARRVGARHGRPVVLTIDAAAMRAAGLVFYCSANGVWLTDSVAPEYLRPNPPAPATPEGQP